MASPITKITELFKRMTSSKAKAPAPTPTPEPAKPEPAGKVRTASGVGTGAVHVPCRGLRSWPLQLSSRGGHDVSALWEGRMTMHRLAARREQDDEQPRAEDDAVRAVVMRLSRAHPSGGRTIERAAILASGTDSGAILAWIDAHAGEPEAREPAAAGRGLHSSRLSDRAGADTRQPLRYTLPPGALVLSGFRRYDRGLTEAQDSQSLHGVHGDILTAISEGMVALLKEFYGRGPTQAKTYYQDDLVVCLLRGGFTRVEQTLFDSGRGHAVIQQRMEFQEVMRERFRAVIEHATGRNVIGFMSGNQQNPDMICEVFVLSPSSLVEPHELPAATGASLAAARPGRSGRTARSRGRDPRGGRQMKCITRRPESCSTASTNRCSIAFWNALRFSRTIGTRSSSISVFSTSVYTPPSTQASRSSPISRVLIVPGGSPVVDARAARPSPATRPPRAGLRRYDPATRRLVLRRASHDRRAALPGPSGVAIAATSSLGSPARWAFGLALRARRAATRRTSGS